jgi:hypothetical protein
LFTIGGPDIPPQHSETLLLADEEVTPCMVVDADAVGGFELLSGDFSIA